MPSSSPRRRRFLPDPELGEATFVGRLLRQETVGGGVVLAAALVAVVWANSSFADAYVHLQHVQVGPLDLEAWAADGGLAIFFYVAGLELKREMVVGSLRRPADALVPIVAALAGVATPALVYLAVNLIGDGRPSGWAIPAAYFPASFIPQIGLLALSAAEPPSGIEPIDPGMRRSLSLTSCHVACSIASIT